MDFPAHQLTMTVLMTPDTANFAGKVHGGTILKLLDQVAYACASRYAGCYVVTLSVDQVMFRQPIQVGELVTFRASVNHTGNSSMEVGIKVVAENIQSRIVRHVNSCFFTMVAVDEQGKPASVPVFIPATADERRRHTAAQMRREMRREMEQQSSTIRSAQISAGYSAGFAALAIGAVGADMAIRKGPAAFSDQALPHAGCRHRLCRFTGNTDCATVGNFDHAARRRA